MTGNQYFQIHGEAAGPLPTADPLFKELKILKFQDVFKLNIAKFVYSTINYESPSVFSEWFTFTHNVHSYATTSSTTVNRENYFEVGTTHSTKTLFSRNSNLAKYGAKMIRVSGPNLWNTLPKYIQEAPSASTFKIYLKKYFIQLY